jgi:hypothetical protein
LALEITVLGLEGTVFQLESPVLLQKATLKFTVLQLKLEQLLFTLTSSPLLTGLTQRLQDRDNGLLTANRVITLQLRQRRHLIQGTDTQHSGQKTLERVHVCHSGAAPEIFLRLVGSVQFILTDLPRRPPRSKWNLIAQTAAPARTHSLKG